MTNQVMTREDVVAMEQLIIGKNLPKWIVLPHCKHTVSLDSALAHLIDHDATLRKELIRVNDLLEVQRQQTYRAVELWEDNA